MKTKDLIKNEAKRLFNQKGIKNVTLREVAASLGKSYGNITYHFKTREQLFVTLFRDLNHSLKQLQHELPTTDHLLHYFLILPEYSFDLTVEYLFFYVDYVELKRAYPEFMAKVSEANVRRKEVWLKLMLTLQEKGFLQESLTIEHLKYIIELSAGIRLFYFQAKVNSTLDKAEFSYKVNQLLYPYLSENGKAYFDAFYSS